MNTGILHSITGAQYAEQLLSVDKRSIDRLLEKLSPVNRDLAGWESSLLELKATYWPSPDFPDDVDFDQPECFEWNVVHAFLALANSQGGCVVIGIDETKDHRLRRGDWDPEQVVSEFRGVNVPRMPKFDPRNSVEFKTLRDRVLKRLLSDEACRKGRKFRFEKRVQGRSDKPVHLYELTAGTVQRLRKLVEVYNCHSDIVGCDVLAVIVKPVAKGESLLEVSRKVDNVLEKQVVFYRGASSAETLEIRSLEDYERYKNTREPASCQFLDELAEPLQKVPRTHGFVFSTMPQPIPTFTGRTDELERIRALCQEGRIPLVQAAGGTGKTQLLLRYAQQYSEFYPGGRFFLQLDNARTWKTVLDLLTPLTYNMAGMTPRQWLGLPEYVEKRNADGGPTGEMMQVVLTEEEIVGALARKSQTTGPILIVLDNLDVPEKLLSQPVLGAVFPCGIPGGVHFMATARTAEHITARRTPAVTLVDLPDLSEDEAVRVLCGDEPLSPREAVLAREIACMLGCRALYLQRVSWLIDDERMNDNPAPLAAVKRILATDLLEAVQPHDNDVRTPAVLWKWLQARLGREPESGKLIALLRAIAFYPPAGMPVEILEGLWHSDFGRIRGRAMLETVGDGTFERAIQVFLRHKIVTRDETCNRVMMHRLDRLAIQEDTRVSVPGDIGRIGQALAVNPCCSPADWVEILPACREWASFCPRELLNGEELEQILLADPSCDDLVEDWGMISPDGWIRLFAASRRFDGHPACPWHLLDPLKLVVVRRDLFLGPYDRSQIVKEEWLEILYQFPDLYSSCPYPLALYARRRTPRGIRRETTSWGMLLEHRPQLASICQFDQLDVDDWVSILCHSPRYVDCCPLDLLQGGDWARVLEKQPQMIGICPVERLSDSDMYQILGNHPELAERLDRTRLLRMNARMWAHLLFRHRELEKFLPSELRIAFSAQKPRSDGAAQSPVSVDGRGEGEIRGSSWKVPSDSAETEKKDRGRAGATAKVGSSLVPTRLCLSLIRESEKLPREILFCNPQVRDFVDMVDLGKTDRRFSLDLVRTRPCFATEVSWPGIDVAGPNYNFLALHCLIRTSIGRKADEVVISQYGDWDDEDIVWRQMIDKNPDYATIGVLRRAFAGPRRSWTEVLACRHHGWLQAHFKWEGLTSHDWLELLARYPEFKARCSVDQMTEEDRDLLRQLQEEDAVQER